MPAARLEHLNITVSDPLVTAQRLCDLFGWHIRWLGEPGQAIHGGTSIHVGTDDTYLAVYAKGTAPEGMASNSYGIVGGLNHVGIVLDPVDDLDAVEERVLAAGFETHSHADYEPGRRFYFHDTDGIEFEVVSYA
jgi:predicted enzyme related to lactoylglutathione lyase